MLDIGWPELMVVAIILIVVVGPKDLPPMLRAFGKMTSNLRKMAGDFRSQFDDALREAELDEVAKTVADARKLNPMNTVRDALNPLQQAGEEIKTGLDRAASNATADAEATKKVEDIKLGEPEMKLSETPPKVQPEQTAASSKPETSTKVSPAKAPARGKASSTKAKTAAKSTGSKSTSARKKSGSATKTAAATKSTRSTAAKPKAATRKPRTSKTAGSQKKTGDA